MNYYTDDPGVTRVTQLENLLEEIIDGWDGIGDTIILEDDYHEYSAMIDHARTVLLDSLEEE